MRSADQPTAKGAVAPHWLPHENKRRAPLWIAALPFVLLHIACLGILFTGAPLSPLALCAFTYFTRMFGITASYHRYFAHRPYKTTRPLPFLLARLACSA